MIRHAAYALVFALVFLFVVAEVQKLDEMNEVPIWRPT